MIPAADQWGPFAPALTPAERMARLRSLRAIVRLLLGPRARDLANLLREAEADDTLLGAALLMIDTLPSRDRRNILASYGAMERAT